MNRRNFAKNLGSAITFGSLFPTCLKSEGTPLEIGKLDFVEFTKDMFGNEVALLYGAVFKSGDYSQLLKKPIIVSKKHLHDFKNQFDTVWENEIPICLEYRPSVFDGHIGKVTQLKVWNEYLLARVYVPRCVHEMGIFRDTRLLPELLVGSNIKLTGFSLTSNPKDFSLVR